MTTRLIALLGSKDEPTDAVEEYCEYLGAALRAKDFEIQLIRVGWREKGWRRAFAELRNSAESWRGQWFLIQFTALAWSSRGFPIRFKKVLNILRRCGARIAIVFHDPEPYSGSRTVDKIRRAVQLHTMRTAAQSADLAIFTIPLDRISWLGNAPVNTVFIPVGANLPESAIAAAAKSAEVGESPRIAVYGITGGKHGPVETGAIVDAVRSALAKIPKLQLSAFGRHADDCASLLRDSLQGLPVQLSVKGIIPAEEVAQELARADVLLFVRGHISSRRGSAIAGIACGLPVIAYRGQETAAPITEAGVVLVSPENRAELGEALTRVLFDGEYRASLAARSAAAHEKYFSWPAIASRYAEELRRRENLNRR
jgi:glycosyltransferase involved in cell wall biosynthesis